MSIHIAPMLHIALIVISVPKLYESEAWLRRQFLINKKRPEEIAFECKVSHMTIYRYLRKYNLIK